MVKITNGVNVFEVTKGAFDGIYSRQGYRLVDEKAEAKAPKASAAPEKSSHSGQSLSLQAYCSARQTS